MREIIPVKQIAKIITSRINKKTISLILLIGAIVITSTAQAQVTVGAMDSPERAALLQIKDTKNNEEGGVTATKGGFLLPRVGLIKKQQLYPFITAADTANVSKKNHAGLTVYNLNTIEGEGLVPGTYVWDGGKWSLLVEELPRAKFSIICDATARANGTYKTEQDLTTNNYLEFTVDVTEAGSYDLVGLPLAGDKFSFQLKGTFLSKGQFTIKIPGIGRPEIVGETKVQIKNYDSSLCAIDLKVEDSTIIPTYSFDCGSVVVNGSYVVGANMKATNTINITLVSPATAAGAYYEIKTDTKNGYSFAATGSLKGGKEIITLIGTGKPIINQTDAFVITSNSEIGGGATCEAKVKVAARKMTIMGLANADDSYDIGRSGNFLNKVLLNDNYFANNQKSVYPVSGWTFSSYNYPWSSVADAIKAKNPDIILVQFNYYASSDADIAALTNYVNNGGVLIYCSDGDGATTARNQGALKLVQSIFNTTGMSVTDSDSENNMTLQGTGTYITEGPFMNLSGKIMGRDAGNNFNFSIQGFPYEDATVVAFGDAANSKIRAFVHKEKGFVFFGDGAPFAADQSTLPYNWPAKFKTTNGVTVAIPNTYSNPVSYNSHLFLNTLAWAVQYAQMHRAAPIE